MKETTETRGESSGSFNILFKKPTFHYGLNITVRKGEKWAKLRRGDIVRLTDADTANTVAVGEVEAVATLPFYWLQDYNLEAEHDPNCRTVEGLLKEMERVYDGDFTTDDQVTLIYLDVRLIADGK